MQEWISVKDGLPDDSVNMVYAFNENHNYAKDSDTVWVSTKEDNQSWNCDDWLIIDGVTHWAHVQDCVVTNHESMPPPPEQP